ncbi:ATP-dependent DNA helicase [Bordetella genomosp. 9]|uniref:ATP-dependent DNA helicase n=1 Tax=Bordetella genomosp. 9 TaxID=1416803 RepID=A0A261RHV6_9BORD|nr:DEAD/DEAH box helicase [Bordetella genomosp. 9]OZI23893.1 ATP-dependent DNA helicase [Bordetella genomosp. 9]
MTAVRAGALALDAFHPAVATWFRQAFPSPTPAQEAAWPLIRERRPVLIAAPTGSGKTLTAFLAAIDELVRDSIAAGGTLPDETAVVYVSPLKALSNDIQVNLEAPLAGIGQALLRMGLPEHGIRTAVRTGDTTQQDRAAMRKRPPHIIVTTPESLYVLLTSTSGRAMLATTRTVIVDEIHAVAGTKRGSHLALSLARLDALCAAPPARIGLSATQKPLDAVARFLAGAVRAPDCAIVDVGHTRQRDLAIELPPVPLEAVMATDVWDLLYDRMAALATAHRTTLVFVNTRRTAERAARHLAERLGADAVAAHHGSLSKEHRLHAEQRLKRGQLQVLVATASLELGIDIGDVDLVCQVGSPRGISALLQRVGRAGHHVGGIPKGRLFPTSRDDLIECAALLDCVRRGELDLLRIPRAPLDVLAQQIVADVSCREWQEDALYDMVRQAAPYAELPRARFDAVLRMLTAGHLGRNGQRATYLHRDAVARTVRGRRGSQLTAVTSGGAIPENADYAVVLEPQGLNIGTVNEDFAVESLAGDVFQLGNTSYRIVRVETGRVRVEDAQGVPPNIPFWMGEAPGRSDELSVGVARLRARVDALLDGGGAAGAAADAGSAVLQHAADALTEEIGIDLASARQIVDYLARARASLGELPTQDTLILERFFDESGGMQLVLHAPFGSRVNRAWGLALRKRFCRRFNFELQAAATEDAIVLSLSDAHSFPLDEVWAYLRAATAEDVLIQALLDAPLFNVRWRWTAGFALALPRFSGGRKVAPPIQRMRSDDLLASVFPDQAACLENVQGEREIPDHPLVAQALDDCLHEAMDTERWLAILRRIEQGECRLLARDLPAPSPLAMEILSAKPYAFLDDAPLEERRAHAVMARRWSDPAGADDLGALDADAIERVRAEAWPEPRDADEMHETLNELAFVTTNEADTRPSWNTWLQALAETGRACRLRLPSPGDARTTFWVALERLGALLAAYPESDTEPALSPLPEDSAWDPEKARVEIARARLGASGPIATDALATLLRFPPSTLAIALAQLEAEGSIMRGRFTPGAATEEWCERHLLARIHRHTIKRLRSEVEPVSRQDYMRFLFDWQHVSSDARLSGPHALPTILDQLEGYEAPAGAWESELLSARIADYAPDWLDELSRAGKIAWTRLSHPARAAGSRPGAGPVRATPMVILPRRHLRLWQALPHLDEDIDITPRARLAFSALLDGGAMFFDELLAETRLLPGQLEEVLGELVAAGLIAADSYAGLRALLLPASRRTAHAARRRRGAMPDPLEAAGRWAPVRRPGAAAAATAARRPTIPPETLEHIARVLLRRYGVVFWRLLDREADWLPPWREWLPVLHRMEARGDIRGGRFVDGLAGEQFALPEAIPLLRQVRRRPPEGALVRISAIDPLNLCGTLLPGEKVPALAGNRILFRDGLPVASWIARKPVCDPALQGPERERLLRVLIAGETYSAEAEEA